MGNEKWHFGNNGHGLEKNVLESKAFGFYVSLCSLALMC